MGPPFYDALLLDLDGTLLGVTAEFFHGPLVEAMAPHFPLLGREGFRVALFEALNEIMTTPRSGGETNRDGFFRAFSRESGMEEGEAERAFAGFYRETFPCLSSHTSPVPGAGRLVDSAHRAGMRLALATNPIFPRQATLERLSWTGISPDRFAVIPAMEEYSCCKPQVEYFLEVARELGVPPERCLMAGNDESQDLPAARAGMGTFLVDLFPIRGKGRGEVPLGRGDLSDLAALLGLRI